MRFEIAVIVAYLCGMTTAYVLARYFVFERSGRAVHDEYVRFTLVNLVAVIQVWIVSVGLADFVFPRLGFTWHFYTVAHLIGVAVPVFTSFIGHKHFRSRAAQESPTRRSKGAYVHNRVSYLEPPWPLRREWRRGPF